MRIFSGNIVHLLMKIKDSFELGVELCREAQSIGGNELENGLACRRYPTKTTKHGVLAARQTLLGHVTTNISCLTASLVAYKPVCLAPFSQGEGLEVV
jgi:hypothetical protein